MTKTKAELETELFASESARAAQFRQIQLAPRKARQHDEPLGLPKGSVRALITLFAVLGYTVAISFVMWQNAAGAQVIVPESLTSIVLTVVAFYFGTRSGGKEVSGNEIEVTGNFSGEVDEVRGTKNLSK